MPRNCRAYAISLLALATGLGAGFAVMALPLADLGLRGWRLVYLLSLVFLVIAVDLARRLPESRRFEVAHAESPTLSRGRFALLAASGFALNVLVAPASFFQNRYLKDVRGYSASLIALFTLVTNTPGGAGVIVGGRLADIHGRRRVAIVAVLGAAAFTVAMFFVVGVPLWLANTGAAILGGAYVPALGVYTSELFPTGRRGVANGLIAAASLLGSGVGLLAAGRLLDQGMDYGPVMLLLAAGPARRDRAGGRRLPGDRPPHPRAAQPRGPSGGRVGDGRVSGGCAGRWTRLTPPWRRHPSGRGDRRRSRRG